MGNDVPVDESRGPLAGVAQSAHERSWHRCAVLVNEYDKPLLDVFTQPRSLACRPEWGGGVGAHGESAARQRAGINVGYVDLPVWDALKLRRRGCRTPRFPTSVPNPVRDCIFCAHSLRNKPSGLKFLAPKSRGQICRPPTSIDVGCHTART